MEDASAKTTPGGVLLVHGAWFTGAVWDGVAGRLRALGVPVAVAELHRGALSGDTAAAAAAAASIAGHGPVVACGHSYGGTVITGLEPATVAHLVYLAAPMPDEDEDSLGPLAAYPTDLHSSILGDPAGITTIDPSKAGELFFSQVAPDARPALVAGLVSQDMTAGYEHPARVAWRSRPSTYISCTEDHVLHPDLQVRMSERATNAVTWDSDHAALISHEADLVALLARLAGHSEPLA